MKFRVNDRVITTRGVKGKIVKIKDGRYTIKTEHGLELGYDEDELKFHYPEYEGKNKLNPEYVGEKCPKCGTPWSKATFSANTVYHCEKCNKKAEDLILPPPVPTNTYSTTSGTSSADPSTDDLLDEFEQMLLDMDNDPFDCF